MSSRSPNGWVPIKSLHFAPLRLCVNSFRSIAGFRLNVNALIPCDELPRPDRLRRVTGVCQRREMPVLGDHIVCIGRDRAIGEGVVVGIGSDDVKLIMGTHRHQIAGPVDEFDESGEALPSLCAGFGTDDFLLLRQHAIRHCPIHEAENKTIQEHPVRMAHGPCLHEHIGIQANNHAGFVLDR